MVLNILSLLMECITVILLGMYSAFWWINRSNAEPCRYNEALKECYCNRVRVQFSGNVMPKMKFSTFNKSKLELIFLTDKLFLGVSSCDIVSTISSVLIMLLAFLVIGIGVAIAGSVLGCAAVCCRRVSLNFS